MEDSNIEDVNRSSSTIPIENGIDKIRSSYSIIKEHLTSEINKLEDYMFSEMLDFDDFIQAMNNQIDSEKIDSILTTVLRKGNLACEKLIQMLKKYSILKLADIKEFPPKQSPSEMDQFSNINPDMFSSPSMRTFLLNELEINAIVDYMYEWHLIELITHESIRYLPERVQKVGRLLSEMDSITEKTWFVKFCCILKKHAENSPVLEKICHSVSMAQNPDHKKEDDINIPFGNTVKIRTGNLIEERLRQLNIDDMNNLLEDNQHIYDVRDGCVEYVLFNSTGKFSQEDCLEFIRKIIEMEDVKSTLIPGQTFKIAVKKNDDNVSLLDDNGTCLSLFQDKLALILSRSDILKTMVDVNATFLLLEENAIMKKETSQKLSNKDSEIKKQYIMYALSSCSDDQLKTLLQNSKDLELCRYIYDCVQRWKCLNCYRQSILNDKQHVLNEIDTAIMKITLEGHTKVPKCLYEYCVGKADSISRSERAKRFLNFILINGSCLVSFAEVLATRTKICLHHTKCDPCRLGTSAEGITNEETNHEVFNFVINETGLLVAEETKQESARSEKPDTNYEVTAHDESRKHTPGRQISTHEFIEVARDCFVENRKHIPGRQQSTNDYIELPLDCIEKLQLFLTSQTDERPRTVRVLSGEEVLRCKLLQEHKDDKFVLISLK